MRRSRAGEGRRQRVAPAVRLGKASDVMPEKGNPRRSADHLAGDLPCSRAIQKSDNRGHVFRIDEFPEEASDAAPKSSDPDAKITSAVETSRGNRRAAPPMVHSGAEWCMMVIMAQPERVVRQSISLPSGIARRVKSLARRERTSANRVIVDLIETGLETREREKRAFFELAERLANSSDTAEKRRLKEELARMTFGE